MREKEKKSCDCVIGYPLGRPPYTFVLVDTELNLTYYFTQTRRTTTYSTISKETDHHKANLFNPGVIRYWLKYTGPNVLHICPYAFYTHCPYIYFRYIYNTVVFFRVQLFFIFLSGCNMYTLFIL